MERNRKRRRIVQVLCGAVLFILLAGALLASPVDGLSGATPRSQAKGDSKLSGAYVLLLNSQQSPFDEEAACQAFGRFFSQRQAGLAPLAGQTVILYIPKDDAALSAYSQSLVRRAASCQVTLAVRPLGRSFVEKMEQVAGWTGSAIGKNIIITEHSQNGEPFTICGVYEDVCIGSTGNPDTRPTALFYDRYAPMILIKFHEMSPENIKKAQKVLEDVMPDRNVTVTAYYMDMIDLYKDSRTFRDSVMIGGIVTLIIALIGLLGYTSDETNRRGREITIRKVNGATAWSILKMISKDISYIAIPAIVIGMTVAYYSGTGWLEKFTEKAPIGFFIFLAGAMMVYVLIIACVLYRAWAVSNSNPVDSLKSE